MSRPNEPGIDFFLRDTDVAILVRNGHAQPVMPAINRHNRPNPIHLLAGSLRDRLLTAMDYLSMVVEDYEHHRERAWNTRLYLQFKSHVQAGAGGAVPDRRVQDDGP